MKPGNAYLTSFITEMRNYVPELRAKAMTLASPTRSGAVSEEALRVLHRMGHAIAGTAQTLQLQDFAALGMALDEYLGLLLNSQMLPPGSIVAPLTRLTVYLESRINSMEARHRFLPVTPDESREVDRIIAALRAFVPLTETPVDDGALHILATDESNDDIEDDGIPTAKLSEDIQKIVASFLTTDLHGISHFDAEAALGWPEVTAEALGDFIVELGDDVAHMRQQLAAVHDSAQATAAMRIISELAHKVKGAAFMLGLNAIARVGEMIEQLLRTIQRERSELNDAMQRWLVGSMETFDILRARIEIAGTDRDAGDLLLPLQADFAALLAQLLRSAATTPGASAPAARAPGAGSDVEAPTGQVPAMRDSVRIPMRQVERIMTTIGSQQINRVELVRLLRLASTSETDLSRVINRLADLSNRLRAERQTEQQSHPAVTASQEADTWHMPAVRNKVVPAVNASTRSNDQAEFEQLMTMVSEVVSDLRSVDLEIQTALNQLGRQGEYHDYLVELAQRDVLALRLVPLSELVPKLELAARTAAIEAGKEVELLVQGADAEIDRDISEAVADPLLQLVRNAVVHGIETPTERQAAGKFEPARITVRVAVSSDNVTITVGDNGRGINYQQLIAAARLPLQPGEVPLLTEDRAAQMSREEALDLMFVPGLSTVAEMRLTAGSGMGLPTVKRAVESVSGTIAIDSEPGIGTTFALTLPLTLGLVHAFVVSTGDHSFALPIETFRKLAPIDPQQVITDAAGTRAKILSTGSEVAELPIVTLTDLIGHPQIPTSGTSAAIVRVEQRDYAVVFDAVQDEYERLVVRHVPHFYRIRGVRGAAISPHGDLLLILDLPEIIRQALAAGRFATARPTFKSAQSEPLQGNHILIVDDSPSIQRGLSHTLTNAGYAVAVARDGVAAVAQIALEMPRLIILDVEMPELDGYEVLDVLRANATLQHIPVIMLTSRAAPQYRTRAEALGVVEYLTKPSSADELVKTVARVLADPARHA